MTKHGRRTSSEHQRRLRWSLGTMLIGILALNAGQARAPEHESRDREAGTPDERLNRDARRVPEVRHQGEREHIGVLWRKRHGHGPLHRGRPAGERRRTHGSIRGRDRVDADTARGQRPAKEDRERTERVHGNDQEGRYGRHVVLGQQNRRPNQCDRGPAAPGDDEARQGRDRVQRRHQQHAPVRREPADQHRKRRGDRGHGHPPGSSR